MDFTTRSFLFNTWFTCEIENYRYMYTWECSEPWHCALLFMQLDVFKQVWLHSLLLHLWDHVSFKLFHPSCSSTRNGNWVDLLRKLSPLLKACSFRPMLYCYCRQTERDHLMQHMATIFTVSSDYPPPPLPLNCIQISSIACLSGKIMYTYSHFSVERHM